MQELDKQALDVMVFSNLAKVPFGVNIKEYFFDEFHNSPAGWDNFFKAGSWNELGEAERNERESLLNEALAKFDLKRAVFDR